MTPPDISRRDFLKSLGLLALGALPACRRAQEFAVQPEDCPEYMHAGEGVCFATSAPWPFGAWPLLVVCHGGLPTSLQPLPAAGGGRRGVPAWLQATILDLYDPRRLREARFDGKPYPWQGLASVLRAWGQALREGRRVAFLFPLGRSPLRRWQMRRLSAFGGARFYAYDSMEGIPLAERPEELRLQQEAALGQGGCQREMGTGSLAQLMEELPQTEALFILCSADPAAFHPDFAAALEQGDCESFRLCLREDETAKRCRYVLPQCHFLEEWGLDEDAEGQPCLRQALSLPLCPAVSEAELLEALIHGRELLPQSGGESPVRALVTELAGSGWEAALRGSCPLNLLADEGGAAAAAPTAGPVPSSAAGKFYIHPLYLDGRCRHNVSLQECRDTLSGAVGKACVFLPPSYGSPDWLQAGPYLLPAVTRADLAQPLLPLLPGLEPDTPLVPAAAGEELPKRPPQLCGGPYPVEEYRPAVSSTPQWAMLTDLSLCIGCNACTLACRMENNIPVLGREELRKGRDMQWLQLEEYLHPDGRHAFYRPRACRHCQHAPCESVCPVNASLHNSQGLNTMVYPRCVGTRYCAAACPYDARVFNFHDYSARFGQNSALPPNPEVTLRSRGIMEKCSFCVQRINSAQIKGEMPQAACQAACPASALRLVDLCKIDRLQGVTRAFDAEGTEPRSLYLFSRPQEK